MATTKTVTDASYTGCFLALLFVGLISLSGVIYNTPMDITNGTITTSSTNRDLPCFVTTGGHKTEVHVSADDCTSAGSSWAVLLVQRGKEDWKLNGLTACNAHKSVAEFLVDAKIASNHVQGRGSFYRETLHVSQLTRYEKTR